MLVVVCICCCCRYFLPWIKFRIPSWPDRLKYTRLAFLYFGHFEEWPRGEGLHLKGLHLQGLRIGGLHLKNEQQVSLIPCVKPGQEPNTDGLLWRDSSPRRSTVRAMGRSVSIVVTTFVLITRRPSLKLSFGPRKLACSFHPSIHPCEFVDYYLLPFVCMFLFRLESLGTKDPTFHHGPKFLLALV